MKKLLALATSVLLGVSLAVVGSSAAFAGGSDSPTPYTVDQTGITLPAGDTFRDNGHVNIRTNLGNPGLHFEGKCINRTDAECAGARHAAAQFIGKSFIPWSAFGLNGEFCVSWVQISQYNEHFGEGGQAPVCVTKDKPKPPQPDDKEKYTEWVDGPWGCGDTTVTQTRTKQVWTYEWNSHKKEWVKTGPVNTTETQTRNLTDDEQIPYQSADPDGACFNRPDAPAPKTGVETKVNTPVCVVPGNGTASIVTEERTWTKLPEWNEQKNKWVFGKKVFGDWEVQSTETVDDAECIPAPPEPLTGTESKDTSPVCVVPNNGKATVDLLSRDWVQNPAWSNDTHEWSFGEKEYTKWAVVKTTTVDSESCAPEEPQKPKPPVQTPPRDELATTGVDSIFWLYSGGALLVGAGVLALMLGLAARKRRVE